MSEDRPQYGEKAAIPPPELQTHDDLTRAALRKVEECQDKDITALAVYSVVDPNPSAGYLLIYVRNGQSHCNRLGATVNEAQGRIAAIVTFDPRRF